MTQMFAQAAQTGLIEGNGMHISKESVCSCKGVGVGVGVLYQTGSLGTCCNASFSMTPKP